MAVVIGLSRQGQKKLPFYRIVVKQKGTKRDGKFIEIVGNHNPLLNPAVSSFKEERVKHWITEGAIPSLLVSNLLEKSFPGYYKGIVAARKAKIKAKRDARKAKQGPVTKKEISAKKAIKSKPAVKKAKKKK